MDTLMASRYNQNKEAFLHALGSAAQQYAPVYRLDHSASRWGINTGTLRPLAVREEPVVTETRPEGPSWQERLVFWSTAFFSNAKEKLDQWAKTFLADAAAMVDAVLVRGQERLEQAADADGLLAILLYGDFLLGTLPSGAAEGIQERWQRLMEEPSLFDFLNNLTLGLGDEIEGAIAPEGMLSFQHLLDMFGVVTLITGIAKGVKGTLDADGILDDAAKARFGSTNDGLDDAARAVAEQLDDLVDDLVDDAVQATGGEVDKAIPAADLNRAALKMHPTYEPPYWPGTMTYQVRLKEPMQFVRVYGGAPKRVDSWIMRAEDIVGRTAEQVVDKFSLPHKVGEQLYICDVSVPAGTLIEVSGANGIIMHAGGGVQFRAFLKSQRDCTISTK